MKREEAKKMLTNTKVYVNGKSKEIQEKLFKIGFKWSGSSENNISYLDSPFLFINNRITRSSDMNVFNRAGNKEISAYDILNIKIDKCFKLKDGDIFYSTDQGGKHWKTILDRIENCKIYNCADLLLETMNCIS